MPRSMTGFGRSVKTFDGREISVEIKSVNHRFSEFTIKVPKQFSYTEEKLRRLLGSKINRGKVEVYVSVTFTGEPDMTVEANTALIEEYVTALRSVRENLGVSDDIALSHIMRIPDAFSFTKKELDEQEMWSEIESAAKDALNEFIGMRETEGERLKSDILLKLDEIEANVEKIALRSPEVTKKYMERLYTKLSEIMNDRGVDDQRVMTEAAIFADKTAVDEEIVRLKSHIAQYRDLLELNEPIGKRLDFLIQEFNREVNTIGSKCNDLEITKTVLDMKNCVEKIREQIQNIE